MSDIDQVTMLLQRGIVHKNRFRVTIPLPTGIFDSSATAKNDTNDLASLTSESSWTDYLKAGAQAIGGAVRIVNSFFGGSSESSKSLQAMCMISSFPAINIDTTPMAQNGNHIKIGNNISQADIDFTFIIGKDYYEKQLLDAWRALIYDPQTIKMGYHDDYTCDVCIEQLDTEGLSIHKVYLSNAWPVAFNSIDLDKSAVDQFQQYTIGFTFNHLMSDTQYETKSTSSQFLPTQILADIASGNWEDAASKAGTVYRKIKDGNFTGEALLVYRQLDATVKSLVGVSVADFEKMSIGIQRDILGNDNLTATERSSLLQLLKDVVN